MEMKAPPRRIGLTEGNNRVALQWPAPVPLGSSDACRTIPEMAQPRSPYCKECGHELLDSRWSPLCPVCYEALRQEERREHIRPPRVDESAWTDSALLEANFEAALGGKLP